MNSTPFDDEDDKTIVEVKEKTNETQADPNPEPEAEEAEGTVAFAKKSDLSTRPLHRSTLEDLGPLPSFSQYVERFPIQAALPKQRFAAFCIDTIFIVYLFLVCKILLEFFVFPQSFLKNHSDGFLKFSAFVLFFLYYMIFESLAGSTPGKWICQLKVVDLEGFQPKLSSIFLRNFCRLFDYPFAFLVALVSMEGSPFYQRLGDRAAQTFVIDKAKSKNLPLDLRASPLSSTYIRMLSFSFDLVLYSSLLYLTASSMNPAKPYSIYVFGGLFSVFAWGYFILFELFTTTTPGKFILGRRVIMENGENIDATAAIIRNIFLPLDIFIAYLLIALSRKKQRLGDLIADTLVIKKANHVRGRNGFFTLLLCMAILFYFSSQNPQKSWWLSEFKKIVVKFSNDFNQKIQLGVLENKALEFSNTNTSTQAPDLSHSNNPASNFEKTTAPLEDKKTSSNTTSNLSISEFNLSSGPNPSQLRKDSQFQPGEDVYLFFKISGFQLDNNRMANVKEDAQVLNPDSTIYLEQKKVAEFNQILPSNSPGLVTANFFKLSRDLNPGNYKILITIKDEISKQVFNYEKSLSVQNP